MNTRGSGILLHITSLPSPFGIGDMGPAAHAFADFLVETKQQYWQILPLSPTDLLHGNSPYHSSSAFAFNPLLISPELLVQDGLLEKEILASLPTFPEDHVDYGKVVPWKGDLLEQAYSKFQRQEQRQEYENFCRENAHWLEDYTLFLAIKSHCEGKVWNEWPEDLRSRKPEAMEWARDEFRAFIHKAGWLQYIFSRQWALLKHYCNEKGIRIFGDIPIYVVHDSADVWAHPGLFKLDEEMKPLVVAGVPPDYFSETGQYWGNPVYRWEVLRERGYDWWVDRIAHNLKLFDHVRIDHFRGFQAFWEIPASETNAVNGKWVEGPREDFFDHLAKTFPDMHMIAEDLGFITPDVWELMDRFDFPGMKVLLFAFGNDVATNPYAPHNHVKDCVVYTGTHDNNTVRGWFEKELTPEDRARISSYMGRKLDIADIHWELIRLAMMSVAHTAIIPMQDILGLGEEGRMNLPATELGNWEWRLESSQLSPEVSVRLREMTEIYGRG